jgi:hypothetical protein
VIETTDAKGRETEIGNVIETAASEDAPDLPTTAAVAVGTQMWTPTLRAGTTVTGNEKIDTRVAIDEATANGTATEARAGTGVATMTTGPAVESANLSMTDDAAGGSDAKKPSQGTRVDEAPPRPRRSGSLHPT